MGTVIITGASRGLGLGTAGVFAREGWNVVMAARDGAALDRAAAGLEPGGGRVVAQPADVADPDDVALLVERTLREFGRVDALINNAAIDRAGPVAELSVEDWRAVIDVNLNGVFYGCRAVFEPMKAQGGGAIVNVSSVAGLRGWAGAGAYCASKFALTGFTQALAAEGRAHGIRATVLYPGGMDTGWHAAREPAFLDPRHVGRFIHHLVTQDARFTVNEAVVTPLVEQGYP